MSKILFAVRDNDGMYTDDNCIFYDQHEKEYRYLCYSSYYNYIILGVTQDIAQNMMNNVYLFCKKHAIHKNFHIKEIFIH